MNYPSIWWVKILWIEKFKVKSSIRLIASDTLNFLNLFIMSKVCQLTGKRPIVGNNVSHSNRKTKRRFLPNLQKKRFFIPETNQWVTLKLCTSAMRNISKLGIYEYLQRLEKELAVRDKQAAEQVFACDGGLQFFSHFQNPSQTDTYPPSPPPHP
jgi:large subunit ribosomal protein L28